MILDCTVSVWLPVVTGTLVARLAGLPFVESVAICTPSSSTGLPVSTPRERQKRTSDNRRVTSTVNVAVTLVPSGTSG